MARSADDGGWSVAILPAVLLAAFQPTPALAEGAPAARQWSAPTGGTVEGLAASIAEGHEDDPEASHCKDFTLHAEKVVRYFKLARPVRRHDVLTTDDYPWLPCVLRGSYMKKGKRLFSFELSATLLGEVRYSDGSTVLLWCDKSCQRRVFAGEPCCSGR